MLEKKAGVIAAFPDGGSHKVYVRVKKSGVFTEASIAKLIQGDRRFKVNSFASKVVAKKKSKPVSKR